MSGQADPPAASDDKDLLQQSDDDEAAGSSADLSLARSSPPASDVDLFEENADDVLHDSDAASSGSPSNRSILCTVVEKNE